MSQNQPPQRLRLRDPYDNVPMESKVKVYGRIPRHIDDYFFEKLFKHAIGIGRFSPRQSLINIFFQKLHAECLAAGLVPAYDPDNEHHVADIMSRLNFNRGCDATGRADLPATVSATQPAGRGNVPGPALCAGSATPVTRKQPAKAKRKTQQ